MNDAPPDARQGLALEIVDALSAVVARSWQRIDLRLVRGGHGRARVAEIRTHVAIDPPPPKPPLGLEPGSLQGAANEAFADLLEMLDLGNDVPLDASIERVPGGGFELRIGTQTIAISPTHADLLLFTESLFDALGEVEKSFEPRQKALSAEIAGHDDWEYDASTQTLQLKKGVLPWRALRAVAIGSMAYESESWLWAWANDALPDAARDDVARVRDEAARAPGMSVLRRAELPCSEEFAVRLAAIAALRMDARGIYGAPFGSGVMMLAVMA
jgi:hypothetical protein